MFDGQLLAIQVADAAAARGVKGSGVFFGNRVFKLMRRWPKKIPDPVRLRPTVALRFYGSE
ncbi:MAG: hypothetical protein HYV60_11340 [Planctomycetia bacterium]|nr:hypothetical protein [Planctomycetia bacterium]